MKVEEKTYKQFTVDQITLINGEPVFVQEIQNRTETFNNNAIPLIETDDEDDNSIDKLIISVFDCYSVICQNQFLQESTHISQFISDCILFQNYHILEVRISVYNCLSKLCIKKFKSSFDIIKTEKDFIRSLLFYAQWTENLEILNSIANIIRFLVSISDKNQRKYLVKYGVVDALEFLLFKDIDYDILLEIIGFLMTFSDDIAIQLIEKQILQYFLSCVNQSLPNDSKIIFAEFFARVVRHLPISYSQLLFSNDTVIEIAISAFRTVNPSLAFRILQAFQKLLTGLKEDPQNEFAVKLATILVHSGEFEEDEIFENDKLDAEYTKLRQYLYDLNSDSES
ncbi:hypothetical protein TVAG_587480 [Trichomonas vaginalis G3]|uniref:Uncharacterized protein n=1 Tax=Trichomonas vaginalis (strain ATCC PRA-98 / G3) TaxID=412133 RepID=A2G2W5_TRIV3|nr:armadillo (ARM) repeat-containing protein family [Trichomonas vaginalis G3]EAX88507.1 hypothetical protein TVAG_587480 [Trichomonas vaginalis G3]KAI5497826.1 armadillo (ARM) repeat-containing protein family [Trichomonas vaginalis G3]|eukprot:XP_001301437.1 hypothetical protein [Trichomonas vaginalis G3]